MIPFSQIEHGTSCLEEVEFLEAALTSECNAQDVDVARIAAEVQAEIDASEKEILRHCNIIVAKNADREKRVAAVREEGQARLNGIWKKLANARHELCITNYFESPI